MLTQQGKNTLYYIMLGMLTIVFIVLVSVTNESLTSPIPVMEQPHLLVERTFTDLESDSPYAEAMYSLAREGIIGGYKDQTIRPYAIASRVESLKMLLESSSLERSDIHELHRKYIDDQVDLEFLIFRDIPIDEWFSPYIYKAYRLGMVTGNPDGTFIATKPVNLAEFLKMLLIMEREQIDFDNDHFSPLLGVPAGQWYTPYFVRAKELGILPLHPDREGEETNPSAPLTRGEMSLILYKYRQLRTAGAGEMQGYN